MAKRWVLFALAGLAWGASVSPVEAELVAIHTALPGVQEEDGDSATDDNPYPDGFRLPKADQSLLDLMTDLDRHAEKGLWEKAFLSIDPLFDSAQASMIPLGGGRYVPMRERLWLRLATLPPDGRDAFSLFYDAKARQMMQELTAPEAVGLQEELPAAEHLFERYFMTSVGVEAADRLGDLYFEAGRFDEAEHCWRAILDYRSGGGIDDVQLQAKRLTAMARAGRADLYAALAEALPQRYPDASVTAGGDRVLLADYIARLQAYLPEDQGTSADVATGPELLSPGLPRDDVAIAWRSRFLSEKGKSSIEEAVRNWWGAAASGLTDSVPATTCDQERLYGNWLGSVFAIDLATGKLLWATTPFGEVPGKVQELMNSGRATGGQYSIDVVNGVVIATLIPMENVNWNEPYRLWAIDAESGKVLWKSQSVSELGDASFVGRPLAYADSLLQVSHEGDDPKLTLLALEPRSGKRLWQLPLGTATMSNNYRGNLTSPVPSMIRRDDLLYVLTNNGALIAIDLESRSMRWAVTFPPPPAADENMRWNGGGETAHTQRPGTVVRDGSTLYVKEAGGRRVLAISADDGEILWDHAAAPESVIVGCDEAHLYLLGDGLLARSKTSGVADWSATLPRGGGSYSALLGRDHLLVYTRRGLYEIQTTNGDTRAKFRHKSLTGQDGTLLLTDRLFIGVGSETITAFHRPDATPTDTPSPIDQETP